MFGHGPRDLHAPEEFHRQEQSFMMPGRYDQDPPPYPHQFPPQYEPSAFNHYPPSQGSPFWPHDSPPPPRDGHPPAFTSFYPPQHEYSAGRYPPGPPPSRSAEYPPHYAPRSSPVGEHMQPHQGHTQRQISFEADDRSSDPHSGAYPPHYAPHSSSFGEHMQPQQGHTQPYIYSFDAHGRSSEFTHVSSFEEQDRYRSIDAVDHVSHRNSSFPHHTRAIEVDKPSIVQREVAVADEISPPVNVELPNGQLVRVFCKHDRSFNLAVKDNRVLMVEVDTEDEFQQWIRDDKYSIRVRDNCGHPAFMLINKGSKKALKHGMGKFEEVQLIDYTAHIQDDDLFWTESQDFGEGFKTVRMANDTLLNLSVACGNNIENGSTLILDTWHKKNTQLWKLFPL